MSNYTDASLIYYPSGYKAGTAYSLKPTDGSGDLTFTRASTATRVNAEGLIEEVATGVPRIDFTGGGCGKLLLEPQRTNIALRSNELSTAPNVIDGTTATVNFYTSPDGTTNAIKLAETTANDRHGFYQYYTVTAQTYTVSVFTKQIGRRYISLMSDFTGTNTFSYFDLQNKVVVSNGSGYTCSIEEFSDGWLRLSATVNAISGSRYTIWGGSTNGTTNTYVGNTSTFMTFYGLQVEAGSYPTSYIPTTSTAVTRVVDGPSKTAATALIGQTQGTIFFDSFFDDLDTVNFSISDGTSSNYILIDSSGGAVVFARVQQGGVVQAQINTTAGFYTAGTRLKCAIAYNSNDIAFFINGVLVGVDTSATIPACNQIRFARWNGVVAAAQRVQAAILLPTRLSNAELATLTTL